MACAAKAELEEPLKRADILLVRLSADSASGMVSTSVSRVLVWAVWAFALRRVVSSATRACWACPVSLALFSRRARASMDFSALVLPADALMACCTPEVLLMLSDMAVLALACFGACNVVSGASPHGCVFHSAPR